MKKTIIIFCIALAGTLAWHYRFTLQKYFNKLPDIASSPLVQQIKEDISAPPPLIGDLTGQSANLTNQGVIFWTNKNRADNGQLPPLTENTKLDQAAQLKLADMFKQQYFEHVNPQGVGPGDLAKKTGYNYLSEGENLALGNYKDDQVLVEAWMNSPGHRANILNSKYTEIGVAVGKGVYEGHVTWLAVQEFGRPASDCPAVDVSLKTQINEQQREINAEQGQLEQMKQQLSNSHPQTQQDYDEYNKQVAAYNQAVAIYNNKLDVLKQKIAQYNDQVNAYNACLDK